MSNITTRIPPSPTGHLHIGTARTALFNYLFTKKQGGTIVFRSEDTDRERSKPEFEAEILEGLEWLGLEWDEFSRQSERSEIYKNHLETLIEEGKAYISKEESKNEPGKMVEVVRLKNQNKIITFTDVIRGEISSDTTELGDFVIARSIDDALYHFTVVVDDFLSGVTHVIRGEDHISNTARQILIQEAIGAPRPIYAHLPLILAADRSKLSKRHGAVALNEYRKEGFLQGAIVNYLALLGWNPGTEQEIFTLPELVDAFDLSQVQKSGAIFDREKFLWFNREHIKRLSDAEFADILSDRIPELVANYPAVITKLTPLIRERISVLSDIEKECKDGEFTFAFETPAPTAELLKWKKDESVQDALPRLEKAYSLLENASEELTPDEAKNILWDYAEEVGRGELLWPLRVALTGKEKSPDPFTVIAILGKTESLNRIKKACDTIKSA